MGFLKSYTNFINRLLPKRMRSEEGSVGVVLTAAAAAYSAYSASKSGGDKPPEAKVQKKTESGVQMSDMDMLFDQESEAAMKAFTDQVGQWAQNDQNFFQNVFQPFQNELIQTNSAMLPIIEKTSANALEQIGRDMVSNETMKSAFRSNIESGTMAGTDVMNKLVTELDNLPTEDQRVAQAFATVEGQFSQAGKDLARQFAERGQAVTQSSARELAIEKAKAKAGVGDAAREGARAERQSALSQGLGVIGGATAQSTQQLLGTQAGQELGLRATGTQVGGVAEAQGGAKLAGVQSDLVARAAEKVLGTENVQRDTQYTQRGIKDPAAQYIDPATGGYTQERKDEIAARKAEEEAAAAAAAAARADAAAGGVYSPDRGESGGVRTGGVAEHDYGYTGGGSRDIADNGETLR